MVALSPGPRTPAPNRTIISPCSEFYWPPVVRASDTIDLDASLLWHRKVGTPTGGIVYTTATASSIATTYGEDLIKIVAAGSGDGWKTTWTYANERRVKSGRYLAALVAVYLVTSSRTVTVSLVSSVPTTIASATVTTTGSWQLVALEPGSTALDGTTATIQATLDGAGTFYVIPLSALISTAASPLAMPLGHRWVRYVNCESSSQVGATQTSVADPNTWTDLDASSLVSSLAMIINAEVAYSEADSSSTWDIFLRRKGSSDAVGLWIASLRAAGAHIAEAYGGQIIALNDAKVLQFRIDRTAGSGTIDGVYFFRQGFWEWA